jgi:hypothetical protein
MTLGLAGTYAVAERPEQIAGLLTGPEADPMTAVRGRAARLARTWSRR